MVISGALGHVATPPLDVTGMRIDENTSAGSGRDDETAGAKI